MSANHDLLLLESVRRLSAKLEALGAGLRILHQRLTRAERQLAASVAAEAMHHAVTAVRLDRLEARLQQMARRPEATDRSDPA
jgi:hypothetical protein